MLAFFLPVMQTHGCCWLSRNLVWVIFYLYDTFHAELSYSKVAFTLNRLSVILLVVVLSCSFVARKNQSARHKQKQSFCVLLTSRKRHSSVTQNLPQTTSRPNIGGKRTRFSRSNSNRICIAQTTFALSPLFGRLFAVFLIVPVFYWSYLCW